MKIIKKNPDDLHSGIFDTGPFLLVHPIFTTRTNFLRIYKQHETPWIQARVHQMTDKQITATAETISFVITGISKPAIGMVFSIASAQLLYREEVN